MGLRLVMNKSDVLPIFIRWQKYVEQYFNQKIKMVQSYWGGEYRSLNNFFAKLCRYPSCFLSSHTPTKWSCRT